MAKKKVWTESAVFNQLRHVWPDGAYVRLPQVRNGTGVARAKTRTADAMIASCWPSRGLWLAGVEIKVSLQDWKKELANPDKADEIGKYCDYWYAAAPAGVIPHEQVPETWGLVEVTGSTAKIVKSAARREDPKTVDRLLMCSILRSADKLMITRDAAKAEQEAAVAKASEGQERFKNNDYELKRLREQVQNFEELSGVKIEERWSFGNVAKALKVIQDAGDPARALKNLKSQAETVVRVSKKIEELLVEMVEDLSDA